MGPGVDPNSGLIYMQARWYDPSTGQFLSLDPLEAQTGQAYAYGNDNPTDNSDPTGDAAIGLGPAIGADGAAAAFGPAVGSVGPAGTTGAEDEPNLGNLERLSDREVGRILKDEGTEPHADKEATVGQGAAGDYNYYVDKTTGKIYLVPGRSGEMGQPISTGLSR